MKRFWHEVAVTPERGIVLDGRPVRTPGRLPLVLPTDALAQMVADEWRAVTDSIDPRAMPMTGLANAAIERVAADPAAFAETLARYAENDLLCYRAEAPAELVARQAAAWDPPLAWAQERYDVRFVVAAGIIHRAQPADTLARVGAAVAARDVFALAALSPITTLTGSIVLALGLVEGAFTSDATWKAAHVDESWQAERWGEDAAAAALLAERRREFDAAVRFLTAL
ncbi:ATP12 family chaperone protein [Sphingomonas sp.]|jgi:chaperone required for assembly of F1-ATPase|uniref:ATP12 family chaperone protein n=1 Tax=Sphingomonas sp. TaxID=28214 RepID=UPI002ED8C2A6